MGTGPGPCNFVDKFLSKRIVEPKSWILLCQPFVLAKFWNEFTWAGIIFTAVEDRGPVCSWSAAHSRPCVFVHFLCFGGLHGWGVMISCIWNFYVLQGCMGGGVMILFIWNFPVLQGCMGGGGGHDTVILEFSGFAGLNGVLARGKIFFELGPYQELVKFKVFLGSIS